MLRFLVINGVTDTGRFSFQRNYMLVNGISKSSAMKRLTMKRKTKQKDPDLDAESAETLIWTCSACGADNPDSKQSCISCGGARAGDTATPKAPEPVEEQEPKELDEPEPLEASEPEKIDAEETPPEPTIFSFDTSEKIRNRHYQNLKLPPSCQPLPH